MNVIGIMMELSNCVFFLPFFIIAVTLLIDSGCGLLGSSFSSNKSQIDKCTVWLCSILPISLISCPNLSHLFMQLVRIIWNFVPLMRVANSVSIRETSGEHLSCSHASHGLKRKKIRRMLSKANPLEKIFLLHWYQLYYLIITEKSF
jgi:hypothetical protein